MAVRYDVASKVLPERLRAALCQAGLLDPVLLESFTSFNREVESVAVEVALDFGCAEDCVIAEIAYS